MKRLLFVLLAGTMFALPPHAWAEDKIKVVTTIPDLADMARQVGGDLIDVTSLCTGVEDIHSVPMKPSHAVLLNRADLLVLMGFDGEHAFLPGLIDASANPKIRPGAPGYVDCSVYVRPLQVPLRIDRALGDIHPQGNHHFNLDPAEGKDMVHAIADGLSRNFPQHEDVFRKNEAAYLAKLDAAIHRWDVEATALRGKKVVSYHSGMLYFADRYGMESFGTIEPYPGVDPTPSHTKDLMEKMQQAKVDFVVREVGYPVELAKTIADRTGAKLVEIPLMVGGTPEATDYISFIDYNVRVLVGATQGY
jgi:zinc/manganese transport system substrate-binding protein